MDWKICDVHGHFLPGMDDGSRSVEESLKMLQASYDQGVRRMFATPHYYPVETVTDFLNRRNAAKAALDRSIDAYSAPLPQIKLGAEVACRSGLSYEPLLDQLCLEGTRYLLLELPFAPWGSDVVREVRNISSVRGLTPVIAHIERYLDLQKRDTVAAILECNVLVQMNAGDLLQLRTRGRARRLLQSGIVNVLGSDCHNLSDRAPNLGNALDYLLKKGKEDILSELAYFSDELFGEYPEF